MIGRVLDMLGAVGVGEGSRERRATLARVDARLRDAAAGARAPAPRGLGQRAMSRVWETVPDARAARWWSHPSVAAAAVVCAAVAVSVGVLLTPAQPGAQPGAGPGARPGPSAGVSGSALVDSIVLAGRRLSASPRVSALEAAYLDEGERMLEDARRVATLVRDSVAPVREVLGGGGVTH